MSHREVIHQVKADLKARVSEKVAETRTRVEYKRESRGVVDEITRLATISGIDSRRAWLKDEIRCLHLIYGYIRGQDYLRIEPKHKKVIPIVDVADGCAEFLEGVTNDDIIAWVRGGESKYKRTSMRPAMEEQGAIG